MTSFELGDVVFVSFPFTDPTAHKLRPAVIVSSAAYHRERQDLILMAITSQARGAGHLGEVELRAWRLAGLLEPSVVKPVLATVEKGLVRKKLGHLEASDAASLRAALATIVG